jgi:hypothetical protein
MSTPDVTRPVTTRVVVARLAEQAIAVTDGIFATRGRGRWLTGDGDREIPGVVVGEDGAGHIDIALHLIASWPPRPLPELVHGLRERLTAAAVRAGLGERIGRIDAIIHDVGDAGAGEPS